MTAQHTPKHAPLATDGPDFDDRIIDANGERIAEVVYGDYIERVHMARRIVACVNACTGFSYEELDGANLFRDSIESDNEIQDLKKQIGQLAALNAELLDAVNTVIDEFHGMRNESDNAELFNAIIKLEVIAKAKALQS